MPGVRGDKSESGTASNSRTDHVELLGQVWQEAAAHKGIYMCIYKCMCVRVYVCVCASLCVAINKQCVCGTFVCSLVSPLSPFVLFIARPSISGSALDQMQNAE